MLEVIGAGIGRVVETDFFALYEQSKMCANNYSTLERLQQTPQPTGRLNFSTGDFPSFLEQIRVVTGKFFWTYWRSPNYNTTRNLFMLAIALLLGLNFLGVKPDTVASTQSVLGVLFYSSMYTAQINYMLALPLIFGERTVYYREIQSKLYAPGAYSIGIALVELPYLLMSSLVFTLLFFNLVGIVPMEDPDYWTKMGQYWLIYFLYLSQSTFFGVALAAFAPTIQVAQIIGNIVICVWYLLGGMYFPFPGIQKEWMWLAAIMPSSYVFRALCLSQFSCDPQNQSCPTVSVAGAATRVMYMRDPYLSEYIADEYGFTTVNSTYYGYGISENLAPTQDKWQDILALAMFGLIYQVVIFIGFWKVKHIVR